MKQTVVTWIPIEESFLLGAVGGCSKVTQMLTVSFWGWVEVVVGGRSRGAGTGGTAEGAGTGTGTGRGLVPLARLPVRMLQRLSEELLRPDWLLASLPRSCWSRYVSWADSVLLCNVTEMRGLEVVRGGTGGGAFLLLTGIRKKKKKQSLEWETCSLPFNYWQKKETEPTDADLSPKHKAIKDGLSEYKPALCPYCSSIWLYLKLPHYVWCKPADGCAPSTSFWLWGSSFTCHTFIVLFLWGL